uniref:Uncharacterized protein n=1 Tax=Cacopsylla melanoneura TaxID=428564 RepID=A0A8D8S9A0_9HEMI
MLQMLPNTSPTYLGYPSTPITLLRSCVSSRATRLRTMTSGHPLWSPPVSDKQCYTVWSSVWKPRRRKKMKKKSNPRQEGVRGRLDLPNPSSRSPREHPWRVRPRSLF